MNQANAILRLLGRQYKFYQTSAASTPASLKENYMVDWALETSLDLWSSKAYRRWFMSNEDKEADKLAIENFAKFNNQVARMLAKRASAKDKFFAGRRLSIADFTLFSHYLCMSHNEAAKGKAVKKEALKVVKKTPIV